ncbi:tungstate ABC transporter substrate-binding protein WtpA [Pyrofollis japonicus]|uniref:tungstate ABC transporter substrate-binding protein WtpA n=1 Tax=Pyrofollis japonicus TaxID=3060460 RepID=UPI00295AC711|nr:tungstate ABC transporter substrate-binding protein WtpA [Pyrofollis japonicus]BEP17386.1 tungstate ABC transporter substrate-binding protein WtpA [Pyrofollis japonicus]
MGTRFGTALAAILVVVLVATLLLYESRDQWRLRKGGEIVVCNAGSLILPLQELAKGFEKKYGIRVLLEPSGSVLAVRKVTELGKNCDIVAVADYRLIPRMMVPDYADWYIAFASNSLVIVFTDKSRYAQEAMSSSGDLSVFRILARNGVRYGFSDPNLDPCGYRAVGVIGLASLETGNTSLLKSLIIDKIRGARYEVVNGTLHIYIPPSPEASGNLVIRPKSIDLISLLEAGSLDYAFEYSSVAVQHNLSYVELPPSINLADPGMASRYARVVVHIMAGTDKEKAIPMAPIIYGVTVPKNAEHHKEAILFVKYLLSEGRSVFEEMGQPFLEKPLGYGNLPEEIRGLVRHEG